MEAEARFYVTEYDLHRLARLLESQRSRKTPEPDHLRTLRKSLETAVVVPAEQIPAYVITLNSRFRLKDLDTGDEAEYTLVFPSKADIRQGKISILAPIGAGLVGARELDTLSVTTPVGLKHFRVESILYQPEAAEDYHL